MRLVKSPKKDGSPFGLPPLRTDRAQPQRRSATSSSCQSSLRKVDRALSSYLFLLAAFFLVAFLATFFFVAFLAAFFLVAFLATFFLVAFLATFFFVAFLAAFFLVAFLATFFFAAFFTTFFFVAFLATFFFVALLAAFFAIAIHLVLKKVNSEGSPSASCMDEQRCFAKRSTTLFISNVLT